MPKRSDETDNIQPMTHLHKGSLPSFPLTRATGSWIHTYDPELGTSKINDQSQFTFNTLFSRFVPPFD